MGEQLSNAQLRRALRATLELAELPELAEYPARAAAVLRGLIPCDIASYNAVDLSSLEVTVAADPVDSVFAGGEEVFAQFAHQNPILSHHTSSPDGSALRISDFITGPQLHRTDLYNEVYRHLQIEHQLAITVPSNRCALGRPSEVIGLTLSRARRDFTESERLLLEHLRPHFAASLRRLHELALLRATGTQADQQPERWTLLVSREGTVAWMTRAAARGLGLIVGEPLPAALRHWAAAQRAALDRDCQMSARSERALASGGVRMRARMVPDAYPRLDAVQLAPMDSLPGAEALRSLSLTHRQAEVFALALEGQTSIQIGNALTLSPRTVEKHFDAIYASLGASNRTQAITIALQALDAPQRRPLLDPAA
jgi:DNA-binding NarL/FixJ family response regulator